MLKETNLNAVKQYAKSMLIWPPRKVVEFPFLVSHPFFENSVFPGKDMNVINILESDKDLQYAINFMEKRIDSAKDYMTFSYLLTKPYRLFFYKETKRYASEEDAGAFLTNVWRAVENPNAEVNETMFQKLKMFKEISQEYLMDEEELKKFYELPEIVTVFRGLQGPRTKIKALSWTLDKDKAEWFANRWKKGNGVYQATINKKYIIACFEYESEVIVDYRRLENIERIN